MKHSYRLFALLLAACLLLSACAKGGASLLPTETEESGQTETAPAQETAASYPAVPDPVTRAQLEAIPTAAPGMTEDQLRQIVVDYARLQQSFRWTPSRDLDYTCDWADSADQNGMLHCKAGKVYGGLPYGSAAGSLYAILDYYDETTGVLNTSTFGSGFGTYLANNCGSSLMWAFARISAGVNYAGTISMTEANGCIHLGPYTYDLTQTDFKTVGTDAICQKNGQQTMFESYALLKKADGVVTYTGGVTGHTRLACENANVVRKADGTIDGEASTVTCIEQYSKQKDTTYADGTKIWQHGSLEQTYRFSDLFGNGYIPFTMAELCGKAAVEESKADLSIADADSTAPSAEKLGGATITTNYMIAKVTLRAEKDGAQVLSVTRYCTQGKPVREYAVADILSARDRITVSGANVTLNVLLSSGETVTLYNGPVA